MPPLAPDAFIDPAARIEGRVRLGARSRIEGRREVPNDHASGCVDGACSRTGANVTLAPGVKVGSWGAAGPGVVLTEDLPSRTLAAVRQEPVRQPWGPERHGWQAGRKRACDGSRSTTASSM